ncbi:unnamed protein product [Triticum turgidum subsp. durum]|uniref:Uncharacterized protein n=1 Tax=Triticum turgidum subsp. durum TaxID=4567 RepID=A0A9R0TVG3_TRITD|nr:unnamed protein product [Triticum turgidum subsp. durum]
MTSSRSNYRVMTAEEEEAADRCVDWIFVYITVYSLGIFAFSDVISYTHVFAGATRFDKIFFEILGAPFLPIGLGFICLLLQEDGPFRNKHATARVADLPPADVC